ncbi:uncharacterized protein [Venturia canescens]|uniref:uncharacterized protein n=1 Tax=Venturia canescens TaxID=32260 RepID=UPI001C9D314C|nr:uncharacterized protein LOC122411661 [Venturia canescens]XP_043276573.1 uncharacterized protein LOC122411661 [Venturia canescens]XP_043276574.1 uncharacterized protein LOC122411661 [Venturia canescens]XP_043276575.1 uncharacterized protein LOC122411661 [Venturia canescens]XP_043276576.1 uncharacterized protein LOC122411661 [Venturia canescens]
MLSQDPPVNPTKSKEDLPIPRLKKNKKLESRWGIGYYDAINKAVFNTDYTPYMPSEPPASIKKDVDKTGYVCKQCRDCFRFLSSIEEHTSRRSWILGYWCQSCFTIKCTHVGQNQPPCVACRNVEASKRAYLSDIGATKNIKKGVIRVFYNQCQFFAHLRMHGILTVDLNDIMLMPLPTGIQHEDYGQLDKLCKALMETMFIKQIHIMDWMRGMNLQLTHWKTFLNWMESKKKNPISDILSRYSKNSMNAKDLGERTQKNKPLENSTTASSVSDQSNSAQDEKDPLAEDETDTANAIAFVDCGSMPSNLLLSEFSEVNSSGGSHNDPTDERAKSLWPSFSEQHDRCMDKSSDVTSNTCKELTRPSSSPVTMISRQTPRVLTIRSSKGLSLSTIIKHLPTETVNTKNTQNSLVVGSSCEAENRSIELPDHLQQPTITINQPTISSQLKGNEKILILDEKCTKNQKIDPKINSSTSGPVKNKKSDVVPVSAKPQSFSEQISLHGRIVFQNGKKYIVRHVPKSKSQSILQDPIIKKLRNPPPLIAPISGRKVVSILPKIMPGTKLSTIFGIDPTQTKKTVPITRVCKRSRTLAKIVTPTGFPLTTVKANLTSQDSKARLSKMQKTLLVKCREALMNDLHRVSPTQLESYIEHLKEITERYSRKVNSKDDSVRTNNMKTITAFENMRELVKGNEPTRSNKEVHTRDEFENNIRQWEKRIKGTGRVRICETCGKTLKPDNYIVGICIPPIHPTIYCQCNDNICCICEANQGSLLQLKTHIKLHRGEMPFMCPSCSIVFPTSAELEVHVWTTCFHPMERYIYGCGVCEIEGILDMESITRHFILLHSRTKIICTECKMEYPEAPTSDDYTKHHSQHHSDLEKMPEPRRLLVCSLKQCIVRPELFRAHLSDHVGVLRWIYYKCPFCTTITQGSERNKSLMREHLVKFHLNRMHEIVSKECLSRIINDIQLTPVMSSIIDIRAGQIPEVSNSDQTGPKILDARTITPATFEYGPDTSETVLNNDESRLPRILEVRSEAVEEFESENAEANDIRLEIISVKSIADCSPESPEIPRETSKEASGESAGLSEHPGTITLRLNSSLIQEQLGCEDSSNSHEEISVISVNSKGDDSELENTFSLAELSSENVDDVTKDFTNPTHIKSVVASKESLAQKPWRIALNSPIDTESEPITYNCHLCGELINTSWSVIKNHFDTNHSGDYEIFALSPNVPRVSMDFIDDSASNPKDSIDNNKKRKIDIVAAISPKRRRRWGPKKHIERPGSPSFGICVRPEPVQQIEGTFRCKKCDQPFEDRSMLRNHIATEHRIKGQYLICLECGENFVVVPSLQMHLKALHGIEDPITYLTKNTAYAPDVLDDTEEDEKATESNQCYVCMAVFEDKPALDKHMRVHGMAFLKRRRFEALKAWKSTSKINESPNMDMKDRKIDEKSQNSSNGFEDSSKQQESHNDNESPSRMLEDKLSKEQIQNVDKSVIKKDQIETLPTAT